MADRTRNTPEHDQRGQRMSRSVKLDTESLRESQARSQQADRIGPDQERNDLVERGERD